MQHLDSFSSTCLTLTDDGSLVPVDELEGLYLYWCSGTGETPVGTPALLESLAGLGAEPVQQDGVDYVEGLVLTGDVVADFILEHDFVGAWGVPTRWDVDALPAIATAS
ncbi:hypothetical protein AC792_15830 [Arthrobacter sp. RIT-PI-e]|uniref:hypothetical protein n=1 Tax=Arthrobacter sp. RIT-PI-e TaxID=1681197 RepID=UPI00067620D6|nr:hypothetical protein [Arthrobacter sp. RIT-PI-e]KNC13476.1 hypothetical protein AC792_15830 [Arthrobacter sp. RIT-PI-e]